ncbi:hypothetical protein J2Z20_003443 [Paenibacillus sediminis]|uniref:Uncharacterized protein n=1 Tax=Paenibacillus sediminis TaxID=664909 RepID=A0ABS4H7M2_9BACL|nr:hypothetical protein [Paenibacillus sediminis]
MADEIQQLIAINDRISAIEYLRNATYRDLLQW